VYEADVATGTAAPSSASFAQVELFPWRHGDGDEHGGRSCASLFKYCAVTRADYSPHRHPPSNVLGLGSFPAGRDVYVMATFTNAAGETLPSVAGTLIDTVLDDAVQVPIPSTLYQITGVNLYEADVATERPPRKQQLRAGGIIPAAYHRHDTATASGPPPPVANSSGRRAILPRCQPCLRYASIAFSNRNGNLSPR